MITALAVPKRCNERQSVHEGAPAHGHRDEDPLAMRAYFRCSATARQAHRRPGVVTNHRGVEIGVSIYLRTSQKSDGDAASLQPIAKHFRHGYGGESSVA